ncbi:MAG: GDSL-type esterase/lipase family protein [Lachnospiraceae bacterium]
MEKERRKGTWRQVALLLLVAAFLVSGTGIFKKKIEENRQQDIQRQEVEKAFKQMMAAQADGGADAGKGQTKGQNGSSDGQTTEGNGTTQPASGADQSQGQQAPAESRDEYFRDTLFIGDSRTVGLMEYGQIQGATFFANSGMSVYHIYDKKVSVAGMGDVSFDEVLSSKQFRKIFVMLGINELGYPMNSTVKKYAGLIETLRQRQPDAVIYIEANLHVTQKRSAQDAIYNNANIDLFNQEIAKLADGKQIRYVDVNPLFDDGAGNLAEGYTNDATHVLGKYYQVWADWLASGADGQTVP